MTIYMITLIISLTALALFLRGGKLHNYLVTESEGILQGAGFETYQEHPKKLSGGGVDFIDLLAQKGDFMICIEVETSARYVLTNAAKAEQLGLPLVVIVPTRRIRKAVRDKLQQSAISPGGCAIYILLLSQLKQEVMDCFSFFSSANDRRKNK